MPLDHWVNDSIARASALNIVNGCADGTFGPERPVTCEQAVTMIVRAICGQEEAV